MPLKVAQEFLMKEAVVASLKFASGLQEKSVTVWIANASQMQRLFL